MGGKVRRAGIYARISHDAEGEGLGVQRQEADCRALAERLGWAVAGVYVDNDISATRSKVRPEWKRLIDDLRSGAIDAVLAYRVDRMYRKSSVAGTFLRILQQTGAVCQTVASGEVEGRTASGRMVAQMLASVAEHESETTGERRRRAAEQAAEDGRPVLGPRTFGYERDGITVRQSEADVVRRAAEDLLNGVSARTIVRGLNSAGVLTARGKQWNPSSLRVVLTGYRIAGRRQRIAHDACEWLDTSEGPVASHRKCSRTDGGPAKWPPILDAKTWAAVRAHYEGNGRSPIQTRRHLLTGLVVCATCDAELVVRTRKNGKKSYACAAEKNDGKPHAYIMAEPIQEIVSRWAAESTLDGARAVDPSSIAHETRDALDAVQRKLDDLATARYVDETIDDSQFLAAQKPLREQQRKLQAEIDSAEAEARSLRASVASMFEDPGPWEDHLRDNFAAIRADLEAKIDRVVVSPGGRGRPRKPKDARDGWREQVYRQRVHDRVRVEYRPGVEPRLDFPTKAPRSA